MLGDQPRAATVRARGATVCATLGRQAFQRLVQDVLVEQLVGAGPDPEPTRGTTTRGTTPATAAAAMVASVVVTAAQMMDAGSARLLLADDDGEEDETAALPESKLATRPPQRSQSAESGKRNPQYCTRASKAGRNRRVSALVRPLPPPCTSGIDIF